MKVNVKAVSAYGVLSKDTNKWINADKEDEGKAALKSIVAGNTYELDKDNFFTSATLVGELKKKPSGNGRSKATGSDATMSKAEWAAKDVRIGRAGVIQAATIALASNGMEVTQYFDKVEELADKMREYTNKSE